MIRLVDTAARHADVALAVESGVRDVLRSGRYVGGPVVAEVEAVAARLFGRAHGVGVNSGTDALMLALQALGVGPGDEVIVPAISFFATTEAVLAVGADPVFVDVRDDACLDPDLALHARTERTRALIAVHLFGTLCEAPDLGVPVLDDAAQAVGGAPPRVRGVLTAVSTYPTKTWGAAGDGGFVLGDDPELLERVRLLGSHGMRAPHLHERIMGAIARNSRLDAVQAAVLLAHAPRVEARVARRRAIARRYDAELSPAFARLPRDAGSPIGVYAVRCSRRDDARARLAEQGIETSVYYPRPMGNQPAVAHTAPCPNAERLCGELLALPAHEGLSDAQVDHVLSACGFA